MGCDEFVVQLAGISHEGMGFTVSNDASPYDTRVDIQCVD